LENDPLHVLLADDDETDRLIFKEAFEELKIKTIVHTVNNGEQLMDYLNKKDSHLPHLPFLDLNMPRKRFRMFERNKRPHSIPPPRFVTAASVTKMKQRKCSLKLR
jgi:CheY-like chemotaxis protein